MQLQLTAVFEKVRQGYIAFVEELPGANTQGDTLEEAATSRDQRAVGAEDLPRSRSSCAVMPNKRLKLTARVDCGMNRSSARRSLSAIR